MIKTIKNWAWKDIDWHHVKLADIKKVIQADGDVNDVCWEGCLDWRRESYTEHTPLELAVQHGKSIIVKYLLERKADPNVILAKRYRFGDDRYIHDFPLFSLALETRNKKIIDLLFQYGVNPYAFDPTQKPRKTDLCRMGEMYVNSDKPIDCWADHPIATAIQKDNLDVLRKITSAPYTVPKECVENIALLRDRVRRSKNPQTQNVSMYWEAFVDQETRKERRNLRQKLAKAHKTGDLVRKKEIIKQLIDSYEKIQAEKNSLNSRYREAEKYRIIRKEYDSETARAARRAVMAKRAQILGQ